MSEREDRRNAPPPPPAAPDPAPEVQSPNPAAEGLSGDFGTVTTRPGGFTSGGTSDVGTPGHAAASGLANLEQPDDVRAGPDEGADGTGEGGDGGPAGTPAYGTSGHEGLGAPGTDERR